jgi:hypothetical protein
MAVAMPAYSTLKTNLKTILEAVATAEAAESAARNFTVTKDRWRPWIENQQDVALVNVMIDSIQPAGGGSRRYSTQQVTVNFDMYVLGTTEEQVNTGAGTYTVIPADENAALRLDLLIAQVQYAITRMVNQDFGMGAGKVGFSLGGLRLQVYSQEAEEATGQYAPARWSMDVTLPYYPTDDAETNAIAEIDLTMAQALESWAVKYTYGD